MTFIILQFLEPSFARCLSVERSSYLFPGFVNGVFTLYSIYFLNALLVTFFRMGRASATMALARPIVKYYPFCFVLFACFLVGCSDSNLPSPGAPSNEASEKISLSPAPDQSNIPVKQPHVLTESEATDRALELVKVENQSWEKAGFGVVALAHFTIANHSPWTIRDPIIYWQASGESGTSIQHGRETIYAVIPAYSSTGVTNLNLGFIDQQVARLGIQIIGLSLDNFAQAPPPVTLTSNQVFALKKAQAKKAELTASNVLVFQKEQAAAGSAHYEYVLGLRYASGDGVAVDVPKARELLAASSAQGNSDASAALKKLSETAPLMTHSP